MAVWIGGRRRVYKNQGFRSSNYQFIPPTNYGSAEQMSASCSLRYREPLNSRTTWTDLWGSKSAKTRVLEDGASIPLAFEVSKKSLCCQSGYFLVCHVSSTVGLLPSRDQRTHARRLYVGLLFGSSTQRACHTMQNLKNPCRTHNSRCLNLSVELPNLVTLLDASFEGTPKDN